MRKLVAALACRNQGSRLYGKPLQNLDVASGITILDHIFAVLDQLPEIGDLCLGIAEGADNEVYKTLGRPFIVGDEKDVLSRLIACAEHVGGTDVFRITTECPFFAWERLADAWRVHTETGADVTVIEGEPAGSMFEIFRLEALIRSWNEGEERHRSELCSLFIREHRDQFRVEVLESPNPRPDVRLTVDWPEDLIVCRALFKACASQAPLIPLNDLYAEWDAHPEMAEMLAPIHRAGRLW